MFGMFYYIVFIIATSQGLSLYKEYIYTVVYIERVRVCTCHKEQIIITRINPSLIVSVVIMYKSKMNSPPPSPILNNLENGGRKQIINNKIDDVKK